MKVRTRDFDFENKIDQKAEWRYFKIPEEVQKEVDERWFFVYQWIDDKEVKKSIELDFLSKMLWLWPLWLTIMVILAFSGLISTTIWFLVVFSALLIIYLLFLSIFRAIRASKISFLVITNNYYSINQKVWEITDWKIFLDRETLKISDVFEEDLFRENLLDYLKKELQNKYSLWINRYLNFNEDYDYWLFWFRSKEFRQAMIIITLCLIAFAISMAFIYFFWIFLVLLFGTFTAFLNKHYLIWKGHLVILLNEYFKDLEKNSKKIKDLEEFLKKNLKEASKNNWQDWLLTKINSQITDVNKNIKLAMKTNLELIDLLKNSEYDKIFDYWRYNSWLKNRVISPIKWIIEMLQENIFRISQEIKNSEETMQNASDEKLKQNIKVAKSRLEMRKKEIEKHIIIMKSYLEKLEK